MTKIESMFCIALALLALWAASGAGSYVHEQRCKRNVAVLANTLMDQDPDAFINTPYYQHLLCSSVMEYQKP